MATDEAMQGAEQVPESRASHTGDPVSTFPTFGFVW